MKTRQGFKYYKLNEYRGAWERSGYLLQFSEVAEFNRLINELNYTFEKAFTRLTGKDMSEFRDVSLVVEYLPNEKE